MINFKQFFELITEGGNVFKGAPTVRIFLPDIEPTVNFLSSIVGVNLMKNLLGSTGKKESSGDLDIAINSLRMSKDQLIQKLTKWCEERNFKPADYIKKSGISVHFRTPIVNRDSEFVQTDFMFVDDIKFAQFALCNNELPPLKGMHHKVVLSNLAKNLNLRWSGYKGLTDRETQAVIEDKNPTRVAQILLGSERAKERDISSIPAIISFLLKKYKDPQIVSSMLSDAIQTCSKDGVDLNSYIFGTVNENTTASGQRVGVQHLYSEYKPDQYSMPFEQFRDFIDIVSANNNTIQPGNSTISEKADGMAVRFGITPDNKYFLQGSYSGVVTDGNFKGKIKHEPTKLAFESSFNTIKKIVYKTLLRYKKDLDIDGIRVQAEWLYSPLALTRDDNPNVVYFVATNYEKDKLGKWSTFPIINITDYNGKELTDSVKYDIIKSLTDLSTTDVKFLPLDINVFDPIYLGELVNAASQEIDTFISQNPNYESVLYSDSRKRDDVTARKEMRAHLNRILLPYQKRIHNVILNDISSLAGKLGEFEGIVIKLKGPNNDLVFKVISPTFHKQKGRI
jgi:hypothetical protein